VSGSAHISDLKMEVAGSGWVPVRTHFGISSFGVNAWVADEEGGRVIGEHDELGPRAARHEELYFVSDGHATFTVDGDEIDAPTGTFVFVRDPAAKRKAIAREPGTTILAVGGAPGKAFAPSGWERQAPVLASFARKDYAKAIEELEELRAETPDDPAVHFNLACAYSLTGSKSEALDHLRRAVEIGVDFRDNPLDDPDLDAIRDDPEFSAIAGQVDTSRSGS
jgi:tetratricopeptide (TPR) repeat protein